MKLRLPYQIKSSGQGGSEGSFGGQGIAKSNVNVNVGREGREKLGGHGMLIPKSNVGRDGSFGHGIAKSNVRLNVGREGREMLGGHGMLIPKSKVGREGSFGHGIAKSNVKLKVGSPGS